MSFEESLVRHASPTLASIKIASLYSFRFDSYKECLDTINGFNEMMNPRGIHIELLKNTGNFYLIYVYRKSHLLRTLCDEEVQSFLTEYGYSSACEVEDYIETLKYKLKTGNDFPHEIGVFLGYPLNDVKMFIKTNGNHCVLCGDWKVYQDEETARCLFCKYKHCREIYVKLYMAGRRFSDMLVSA